MDWTSYSVQMQSFVSVAVLELDYFPREAQACSVLLQLHKFLNLEEQTTGTRSSVIVEDLMD